MHLFVLAVRGFERRGSSGDFAMASNLSLMRALVGLSRLLRYLNAAPASWTLSANHLDLRKVIHVTPGPLRISGGENFINTISVQHEFAPLSQFKKLIGIGPQSRNGSGY